MDEDDYETIDPPPVDEDVCRVAEAIVEAARVIVRRTGDDLLEMAANEVERAVERYRRPLPRWTSGMAYAKYMRLRGLDALNVALAELRWHMDMAMEGGPVVHLSDYLTDEQIAVCKRHPRERMDEG